MVEFVDVEDLELKAELQAAERLFQVDSIEETTAVKHERDIRKIALLLFLMVFDAEERDNMLFGPHCSDPTIEPQLYNKAEKIYKIAGDYATAQKIVRFLQIVNQDLAQQIIKKL